MHIPRCPSESEGSSSDGFLTDQKVRWYGYAGYRLRVGRFTDANNLVPTTSVYNCFSFDCPRFCISRNSRTLIPLKCDGTRLILASPRIRNAEANKL